MKTKKLIMPLTAVITVGTLVPTIASCSCGGGVSPTPTQQIVITIDPCNGSSPTTKTVKSGTKWSEIKNEISEPYYQDHKLDFWTIDGTTPIADDYTFTQAVTISAHYYETSTITIDTTTGGTISSTASITVPKGTNLSEITLPTATPNPNYYFVGWFDSETGEEVLPIKEIDSNFRLTATFKTADELLEVNSSGMITDLKYQPHGSFTIPYSVVVDGQTRNITSIGASAFVGCLYLESVTINENITSISSSYSNPFAGCISLNSIVVSDSNTKFTSKDSTGKQVRCLIEKNEETSNVTTYKLISGCNTSEIPNDITYIGDEAFAGMSGITSISIPASCKTVGEEAFTGCIGLESVTFANADTTIGTALFTGCIKLASATLPNNIVSIPASTFYGCLSLVSFDLRTYPKLTTIGGSAFAACTSLQSIYISKSINSIGTYYGNPFIGCVSLNSIKVEDGNTTYSSKYQGNEYNCIMNDTATRLICGCSTTQVCSNVSAIGSYAFLGVENLTSITLPNSVTSIEEGAFAETGLTSINLPSNLGTLGTGAFEGTKLTSVSLPNNSNIFISAGTFANIETLTSIYVPESTRYIHRDAFDGCYNITNITVESNNNYYSSKNNSGTNVNVLWCRGDTGSAACGYKGDLLLGSNNQAIQIPSQVDRILPAAFANMDKIITVTSESSANYIYSIGENAFYNCANLQSVSLSTRFTSNEFVVGGRAFEDCRKLTNVNFSFLTPEASDKIVYGDSAFKNCEALTSVFNSNINYWTISSNAFRNCKALTSFNFTGRKVLIDSYAFEGCTGLQSVIINPYYQSTSSSYYAESTIGEYAFNRCTSLIAVSLMPSEQENNRAFITTIGSNAFNGCSQMTTLKFKLSTNSGGYGTIGSYAFSGCIALVNVDLETEIPTGKSWPENWSTSAFTSSTTNTGVFTVINRNTKNLIKTNWSVFKDWTFTV